MREGIFKEAWEKWLSEQPATVRSLAREFPVSSVYDTPDGELWVIGYSEGDEVMLTPLNPYKDYHAAYALHVYVHAQCLRDAIIAGAADVQSH